MGPSGMGIFRRRPKTTASELAQTLFRQIAHPDKRVARSLHVTAQKMQARAKRDVRTIIQELFLFRAYLMVTAVGRALQGADHDVHPRLLELLEADTKFWPPYAERARAYDEAVARCEDDGKPDLLLMATFQEQLGNPDPDNLLIGLRAWHQFAPKTKELAKFLKRQVLIS